MRNIIQSSIITMILVLSSFSLSGCTELLGDSISDPSATLHAWPVEIEVGESVTFDARESDPVDGALEEFEWDFGDGTEITSLVGFISHTYANHGTYTVTVTVTNTVGGSDSATEQIQVNGAPIIELEFPDKVKSGEAVVLNASESYDPEGDSLIFEWDINWLEDSDGDGDPRNDVDYTDASILLLTEASGNIGGSVKLYDAKGASSMESWAIVVETRHFLVEWEERTVVSNWSGYLEQGHVWEQSHFPGDEGRLISLHALLELDRDPFEVEPQDNFTLRVEGAWSAQATTQSGNWTQNESASAELTRDSINPSADTTNETADSAEILIVELLNLPGVREGQGEWIWSVTADQADPDSAIEVIPDPDPGNDWELTITFVILVPILTEIAI